MADLTGDVRRARELAAQMTYWLTAIGPNPTLMGVNHPDLIEWCRSARDTLERIAKLAEDDSDG